MILRQFISNDQYTENHCYRVSIYAAKISSYMHFSQDQIEDIRSAALLHDLGKMEISRKILHKAARLTNEEYQKQTLTPKLFLHSYRLFGAVIWKFRKWLFDSQEL